MLSVLLQSVGLVVVGSVLLWLLLVALSKLRPRTLLDRLPSRAVLITGCDSGFGHQLARRLDGLGVPVFAGCLLPEGPGARSLAADCSSRLRVVPLDVTSDQQVADAVVSVQTALKDMSDTELWAVVNNAGITDFAEAEFTPMENFQKVLDVNTVAAIRVSKAFLPFLKKSKGRLVNVTSPFGKIPIPMQSAYCLSKSALVTFTNVLRMEMKKWSVTVCAVQPALYGTAISDVASLQSKYFENTAKSLSDDKEGIRQEARKNSEAILKASKWLALKNISEVIDEMVTACIGQNVQRTHMPGFIATVVMSTAATLPDSLREFLSHLSLSLIKIIWGR